MYRSMLVGRATWLGALMVLGVASFSAAQAESAPSSSVLVELFTSEGCSSCPPADRLLAELDRKQPIPGVNVIVLSEHVDYWNQLGWHDPFSSHQWSLRQDKYASLFRLDGVYTPQIVVDGRHEVLGSDERAVRIAVEQSAKTPQIPIAITSAVRTSDSVEIAVTAGQAAGATLYAVVADDTDRSSVERGENAGHTLDHVAVAHDLIQTARLDMPVTKQIELKIPAGARNRRLRVVLFAQDDKTGHILAVVAREL
jgi:hypothetical protein